MPLIAWLLAAQAFPTGAAGWHALGAKYAAAGDYELAEPALADACRLEPRRRDACYMLGRVRYLLNRFDQAIPPLRQSLANGESEGRATLALAHEGLDDPRRAEELFTKAVALAAPDAEVRYGMFLLRQGRVVEAVSQARRGAARHPDSAPALVALARAEVQHNALEPARDHLIRALRLAPGHLQAHLLLGRDYARLGDREKADFHLNAARPPVSPATPARP